MSYKELQTALKDFRTAGQPLQCKLNAKKDVLQAEYDRLTATEAEEQPTLEAADPVSAVIEELSYLDYERVAHDVLWTMALVTLTVAKAYMDLIWNVSPYCYRTGVKARQFAISAADFYTKWSVLVLRGEFKTVGRAIANTLEKVRASVVRRGYLVALVTVALVTPLVAKLSARFLFKARYAVAAAVLKFTASLVSFKFTLKVLKSMASNVAFNRLELLLA